MQRSIYAVDIGKESIDPTGFIIITLAEPMRSKAVKI